MRCTILLPVSLTEFMKVNSTVTHCVILVPFETIFDQFLYCTGIAIGGDVFPGSTLSDHILRFNNIPQVF